MPLPAATPMKILRRFRRNRRGSAAVEFALVAPLFFGLLFAIIELAMVFFASQVLETATQDSARMMSSMADFLEGRVPGLEVRRLSAGNVSVRIRGDRSLLRDGEPLYVVDGIPMNGSTGLLPDLDPRDIRSVDVLKDAGSLAAYGSRGANGVILITMKRPPKP